MQRKLSDVRLYAEFLIINHFLDLKVINHLCNLLPSIAVNENCSIGCDSMKKCTITHVSLFLTPPIQRFSAKRGSEIKLVRHESADLELNRSIQFSAKS